MWNLIEQFLNDKIMVDGKRLGRGQLGRWREEMPCTEKSLLI